MIELKEIDLSGCQLTDKSILALCERLQQMEVLRLRDNSLTPEQCKAMAKYLPEAF